MSHKNGRVYEFGPFRLHATRRTLSRDGVPVTLTAKAFDTLLLLVERRGEVLTKGEMMDALWPDAAVEENNLTQQVSLLRKALGERPGSPRYVVTVPGRGYGFVADAREVNGDGPAPEWQPGTHDAVSAVVEGATHRRVPAQARRPPRPFMIRAAARARRRGSGRRPPRSPL
jgi:DNA-binding winged helix-turn-helix (wHTH) protein